MASTMKKVGIGCGIAAAAGIFIIIGVIIIFLLVGDDDTANIPDEENLIGFAASTMNRFALCVQAGDFRELRESASQEMKDEYSLDKFNETFAPFSKLQVDWSEIERYKPILDDKGAIDKDAFLVVNGYYPTAPQKVEFNLKYKNENDTWRLVWIYVNTTPLTDTVTASKNMPSEQEQIQLLANTLLVLDEGIQQNNFSQLYREAAQSFKSMYSEEDVQQMFSALSVMKMDFSVPDEFLPEFDQPVRVDEDGLLRMKGAYDNRDGQRYFEMNYVLEKGIWKMAAIHVNWDHSSLSQSEHVRLVKETMQGFAAAVMAGDFNEFYNSRLADPFKAEYSKEKFQNIFQAFIDQKIDLRILEKYIPEFDEKPGLDAQGMLVLKGYFPTRPSIAIFDMKFIKVREDWKLMRLYINVKPVQK